MAIPNEWKELVTTAQSAAAQAYAPYSKLHVGAALQASEGAIYSGCNVENASYGLTICAERAVVFAAVAKGARTFTRLAIYTPDAGPLAPCGACRQVLAEFGQDLEIFSVGKEGEMRKFRLAELLPEAFGWPAS